MKVKVITGLVATVAFVAVLFTINTIIFPIVICLLAAMAVYEIEKAVGLKNIFIMVLSIAVAALIPLTTITNKSLPVIPIAIFYIIISFIFMILKYENTKIEHVIITIFASIAVPYSFSLMIRFTDLQQTFSSFNLGFSRKEGYFVLLLSLFCAWLTDTFAYFAGSFFGKHKLCPKVSPNKTVEGAVGGVLCTLLLNIALFFIFKKYFFETNHLGLAFVIPASLVLSIVSIFGDLTASALKRAYGIKDFGKLLPGHGGIMDRFDSLLFVMPTLYAMMQLYFSYIYK